MSEQSASLRGHIRIAAPMSFGISHLSPELPAFMQRYPEVTLEVNFSDQQVDLVAQGFDIGLRIATLADSSLLARRLCTVRILLVGAPVYFERQGTPAHPSDLAEHRALHYAHTRSTTAGWRFRHARHGEFSIAVPVPLQVNNAEGLTPALRAGLGLALQPEFLVWEDLQSGALRTAMDDWQVPSIALHVVTPPGRARPARVQALIDFLAARFGHAPWGRSDDA